MAHQLVLSNDQGIDLASDTTRAMLPALYAEQPHARLSANYQMYSSMAIIHKMASNDMILVQAAQQRHARGSLRSPATQPHIMRFRPREYTLPGAAAKFGVGGSVPEAVIKNNHDGRNKFEARFGVFRFICMNGMIVSDVDLGALHNRHYGKKNSTDAIMGLIDGFASNISNVSDRIQRWAEIDLNEAQQFELARRLIDARVEVLNTGKWLTPDLVLERRRPEDEASDLWTTFNVLQENLLSQKIVAPGEGRRGRIHGVDSPVASLNANKALWASADTYLKEIQDGGPVIIDLKPVTVEVENIGEEVARLIEEVSLLPEPQEAPENIETAPEAPEAPETAPESPEEVSAEWTDVSVKGIAYKRKGKVLLTGYEFEAGITPSEKEADTRFKAYRAAKEAERRAAKKQEA